MTKRRPSGFPWADAACGAVVVALTVAHLSYYFPRVVDDLFISLRFAENLAHGRGIVYNPGERVEGYSSPLWMFFQSVGLLFGFEGVTWTKAPRLRVPLRPRMRPSIASRETSSTSKEPARVGPASFVCGQ